MIACLALLTVSILITLYELPPLIKKKLYKESVIFCCLLTLGTFLTMLLALDVHLPNPLNWIIIAVKPLSNLIDNLLS